MVLINETISMVGQGIGYGIFGNGAFIALFLIALAYIIAVKFGIGVAEITLVVVCPLIAGLASFGLLPAFLEGIIWIILAIIIGMALFKVFSGS